jgi:acyl-coenzyme A thioesterase 7
VAGIVAVKHCRSNVVTASVDAMDFHTPVHNGSLLSLYAWPTYTSERSIEITVAVFAESMHSPRPVLCNSSHFTFVSLQGGKVAQMPPLTISTPAEQQRWEEGRQRYLDAKRSRTPKPASL